MEMEIYTFCISLTIELSRNPIELITEALYIELPIETSRTYYSTLQNDPFFDSGKGFQQARSWGAQREGQGKKEDARPESWHLGLGFTWRIMGLSN